MTRRAVLVILRALLGMAVLGTAHRAAAQTTFNASHDLVRLGIASTDMVPNRSDLDAGPLLLKVANYAKSHSTIRVTFDRGAYYFLTLQDGFMHVGISGLDGTTFDFQGAELRFANSHRLGLSLSGSRNTVLENFSMDYVDPPMTQVRITGVDAAARLLRYETLPGWKSPTDFNTAHVPTGFSEAEHVFIFRDGEPAQGLSRLQAVVPMGADSLTLADNRSAWERPEILSRIRAGDIAVVSSRGFGTTLWVLQCVGCTIRNIRVYSASVDGVDVRESSDTLVERVYVMPKPGTDRLMSANADGINFWAPRRNNTLRLSRAIRTGDDGFGPAALALGTVDSQLGPRQLRVRRYSVIRVANGTPVAFQRPTDGVSVGTGRILSQSTPPEKWPDSYELFTVDFEADLPPGLVGSVVYPTDLAQRGSGFVIEQSTVQEQVFARGLSLWGLVDAAIRRNYLWRTHWAAIFGIHRYYTGDWNAPPLERLTISGNVIDEPLQHGGSTNEGAAGIQVHALRNDFTAMTVSPNRDIEISGNVIVNSPRSGVYLGNATGGRVSGNSLVNSAYRPVFDGYTPGTTEPLRTEFQQPIVIKTSSGVVAGPDSVESSERLFVTDRQNVRLAAFAPGMPVRLHAFGAGRLPTPVAVFMGDSVGATIAVQIDNAADHSLDVVVPTSASAGPAVITTLAGERRLVGTLFVDSVDTLPVVNGCTFFLSVSAISLPATASALSVLVVTAPNCSFSARSLDGVAAMSITGSGATVLATTVPANSGRSRTVAFEIGGQWLGIVQAGVVQ